MFIGLTRIPNPSTVGVTGTFVFFNELGQLEVIALPSTTGGTEQRPAFSTWKRGTVTRTYILGQFSENLVATEHKRVLRMGIQAPDTPWANTATPTENQVGYVASGTGLTGAAILYLRYRDSLHNRRSPLSGPSPVINLANQGISIVNAPLSPTPYDSGVDTLDIFVSLDGGLPRLWASRDIGAPNFLVNETVTGEAEVDTLSQYPVLKYGVLANDALFAAGDPRHPNLLYVSLSGSPEEFTGITIPTRNGEEIIGLASIGGDTVYVQCQNSSYYVQGFDESDLIMKILEPKIGGLGHSSIASCHDVAIIPTQLAWYLCTGTSLIPIGVNKWDRTWRDTLAKTGLIDPGFTVTDYVSGVVKHLPANSRIPNIVAFPTEGVSAATFLSYYWTLDISGLVPEAGPGTAPLTFDCRAREDTCAAMLAVPGTLVGGFYTADSSGKVYLENQPGRIDNELSIDGIIHTHHDQIGDIAEPEDAWQVSKVWPIFICERFPVFTTLYIGNDAAWQAVNQETFEIPAGMEQYASRATPPVPGMRVPRTQIIITPQKKTAGSCFSVRLSMAHDTIIPQGFINTDDYGLRVVYDQRAQFLFFGVGAAFVGGVESRPDTLFVASG